MFCSTLYYFMLSGVLCCILCVLLCSVSSDLFCFALFYISIMFIYSLCSGLLSFIILFSVSIFCAFLYSAHPTPLFICIILCSSGSGKSRAERQIKINEEDFSMRHGSASLLVCLSLFLRLSLIPSAGWPAVQWWNVGCTLSHRVRPRLQT